MKIFFCLFFSIALWGMEKRASDDTLEAPDAKKQRRPGWTQLSQEEKVAIAKECVRQLNLGRDLEK